VLSIQPEERHQAVAGEIGIISPRFFHRLRQRRKQRVQQENDVVWQSRLRQGGGATNIDKQNGNLSLFAELPADSVMCRHHQTRMQKRLHRYVNFRPQLTRQAYVTRRANAPESGGFDFPRFGQLSGGFRHEHPASRAARATSAY
jgi:hypothetical protein